MIELQIACLRFTFKRPLLCYLKLLNIIRVIFSKIIIDRKKKLAMRKVDEEDFTTVFALITIASDFIEGQASQRTYVFYVYH